MFHIIGLIMILVWSLGFLTPYTIIGFIEILLLTAFLNLVFKKIRSLNVQKIKLYKESVFNNISLNSSKRSSSTIINLPYKYPVITTPNNKKGVLN